VDGRDKPGHDGGFGNGRWKLRISLIPLLSVVVALD